MSGDQACETIKQTTTETLEQIGETTISKKFDKRSNAITVNGLQIHSNLNPNALEFYPSYLQNKPRIEIKEEIGKLILKDTKYTDDCRKSKQEGNPCEIIFVNPQLKTNLNNDSKIKISEITTNKTEIAKKSFLSKSTKGTNEPDKPTGRSHSNTTKNFRNSNNTNSKANTDNTKCSNSTLIKTITKVSNIQAVKYKNALSQNSSSYTNKSGLPIRSSIQSNSNKVKLTIKSSAQDSKLKKTISKTPRSTTVSNLRKTETQKVS